MTTEEEASKRRGKSIMLSPKFVTDAGLGRLDVPCYGGTITGVSINFYMVSCTERIRGQVG